jgi:hypothetical protein
LKLLNVIVETLKGKIDDVVKEILEFLINEISQNNVRTSYKLALLESVRKNKNKKILGKKEFSIFYQ